MKIAITGGHFSPAYSIIEKIKNKNDIVVIGRKYAFENDTNETYEYKICQKLEIRFIEIKAGRLQRVITKKNFFLTFSYSKKAFLLPLKY